MCQTAGYSVFRLPSTVVSEGHCAGQGTDDRRALLHAIGDIKLENVPMATPIQQTPNQWDEVRSLQILISPDSEPPSIHPIVYPPQFASQSPRPFAGWTSSV
eukprot:1187790-Prorocentrum_minimum.AAC.2